MAPEDHSSEVINLVLDALRELRLEPGLIAHGRVDELRGGIQCYELKAAKAVDAAVLYAKASLGALYSDELRHTYRVDYAVRGTIRGVLPARILSMTAMEMRGVLRKRLVGLSWETPPVDRSGAPSFSRPGAGGLPPAPGEMWEGGPHQELTGRLNGDAEMMEAFKTLSKGKDGEPLGLSIFSDRWGESIRIRGDLWVEASDLPSVYVAPAYLGIINRIGGHIKEVRKSFGGLTF